MKIIVPQRITNKIFVAVQKGGNRETKGALFAKKITDDTFEIEDVYISPVKGTTVFSKLINNHSYRSFESKYHKNHNYDYLNHNYIGDWHSHPLFDCVPSEYDKNELNQELINSNAIFLIQLICKIQNNKLIGRCYYKNRNGFFAECNLLFYDKNVYQQ